MSTEAPEAPPAEEAKKRRPNAGKFAVLKQIKSVEELAELLAGDDEVEVYAVVALDVEARTSPKAIEAFAVGEDAVKTGRYVAPPMASFQPRNVRQVVHMTLD